eukprot:335047-Alexandrium_andersonii.AAC.1
MCIRDRQRGFHLADGFCGALVEMRADLLEFVSACGFKSWSNVENPCFCCTASREQLFDFPPTMDTTWQPRDRQLYQEMVQKCIMKRVVNSKA